MQFLIRNLARFIASVMGTSPAESLNAAGNIFVGQVLFYIYILMIIMVLISVAVEKICLLSY